MKIGVIDIGTNSVHMLMVEILPNFSFEIIGREKEMIRLGDGTLTTGYLSAERMELGLETIKKFKYLAQSKGVHKIRAVATSAVREAHNGGDFLKQIRKETGINVRVITGEEEGRLIYQGVKHSMPLKEGNTLLIDIGGGSVEIMVVTPHELLYLTSLKIGAARLHDQFFKKYRLKEFQKLETYVSDQIREAVETVQDLGFEEVIGTSGTLNNLGAMAFYLHERPDASLTRNPVLSGEDLENIYQQLQGSSLEERLEMRGLDSRRADIILGGAGAARVLFQELGIKEMITCDKAIREGMIYHYIQKNRRKIRSEAEIPDVRKRNVLKLAHKCDYDREHAHQTAKLALQIFDRTQDLHKLSSLDRELLEYASLLHDIGYYISYEKHHRHAYYLIRNVSMNGFSEEEIDIMATVARYHRQSIPKKKHIFFKNLEKSARRRVQWLAAILKLADALDRSHFSVVESLRLRIYDHKIIFILEAVDDAEYEIWEAQQKASLLEQLTGREVEFRARTLPKRKTLRSRAKVQKINKVRAIT